MSHIEQWQPLDDRVGEREVEDAKVALGNEASTGPHAKRREGYPDAVGRHDDAEDVARRRALVPAVETVLKEVDGSTIELLRVMGNATPRFQVGFAKAPSADESEAIMAKLGP